MLGKVLGSIGLALLLALALFAISLAWPMWLLRERMEYRQFEVYSTKPLDQRILPILDSALARLTTSELYDPGSHFTIYLCDGPATFALFAPLSQDAFACTYPVIDHIFVAHADVMNDQVLRPAERYNTRTLSGTLAHELTHVMVEHSLGLWMFSSMPDWKHEGYCDHVAGESSIGREEGLVELCAGSLDHPYFEGRLMVKHLLAKGSTFREVANEQFDADALFKEMKMAKCPAP
ncbi:MAG: hypothetical protein IPK99_13300 [Flavobacteriales bacterium]|nr:hypothetical protein [Flavobacteriales bacterium]